METSNPFPLSTGGIKAMIKVLIALVAEDSVVSSEMLVPCHCVFMWQRHFFKVLTHPRAGAPLMTYSPKCLTS